MFGRRPHERAVYRYRHACHAGRGRWFRRTICLLKYLPGSASKIISIPACKRIDNYATRKNMKRSKLDKIDRKILLTLQEEGRITNVDLAKKAGISAPPCLRRVRALEES